MTPPDIKSNIIKSIIMVLILIISPAISASYQTEIVQKSYIAYYARPADPSGLDYWVGRLNQNDGDIQGIIDGFGNSEEYTSRFSSLSNTELVNNIYQNLFGRDADPSGLTFYVNWLDTGQSSLAKIALNILDGASGNDLIILKNKLDFSHYYTSLVRSNLINYNLSTVVSAISSITASITTFEHAKQQIVNTIKLTGRLNDTGITVCGDYAYSNVHDCNLLIDSKGYPIPPDVRAQGTGQDGHVGRDVTHNDDSDGHAGFSFTKIDANGKVLSAEATGWSCVKDNVTGLIWEIKQGKSNNQKGDSGLHDPDDRYHWYEPDSNKNGGDSGYQSKNYAVCHGYIESDSATYCNTKAYVDRINKTGWCGASDWRLPTEAELRSIVNYQYQDPAIDVDWFPNTQSHSYWSASPVAEDVYDYAALISFYDGRNTNGPKMEHGYVRLVRGGE